MKHLQADSKVGLFVQWLVHLLLIFVCVGAEVPGVNESHYIPKSKHAWDASFAPGDLFLESHNSHFLAAALSGSLSTFLSMPAVAWIGRLISWSLFAWSWIYLSRTVGIARLLSPFALLAWFLAISYGHWAGEWAIGGFEAKAIAYPCILMGLAAMFNERWCWVWIWMGAAVAWHPVVGGWAGISCAVVWFLNHRSHFKQEFMTQVPWLGCGAAIGMIGVVPALGGIFEADRVGNVVASQIQVYMRLGHHMCPRLFAAERHYAAIGSLVALLIATLVWRSKRDQRHAAAKHSVLAVDKLIVVAWTSVAIAMVGLAIDLAMSDPRLPTFQPVIASKLLRFYWFRWADVAVPLAWTAVVWHLASEAVGSYASENTIEDTTPQEKQSAGSLANKTPIGARVTLAAGVLASISLLFIQVQKNFAQSIPPADQLLMEAMGPRKVASDRYVDWLAACAWIRENSPTDSLWLTPKYQQSFKWHAQRAEVVCWKDVPQDNASIIEWYFRIERCAPPRDSRGYLRGWKDSEVLELQKQYEFDWILVDRTIQDAPLQKFEFMYPVDIQNPSFAVFRVNAALATTARGEP